MVDTMDVTELQSYKNNNTLGEGLYPLTLEELTRCAPGTELESMSGRKVVVGVDHIDTDTRYGFIAFGMREKTKDATDIDKTSSKSTVEFLKFLREEQQKIREGMKQAQAKFGDNLDEANRIQWSSLLHANEEEIARIDEEIARLEGHKE